MTLGGFRVQVQVFRVRTTIFVFIMHQFFLFGDPVLPFLGILSPRRPGSRVLLRCTPGMFPVLWFAYTQSVMSSSLRSVPDLQLSACWA